MTLPAESFAAVEVRLPPFPPGPDLEEDDTVALLQRTVEKPGLLGRLFGAGPDEGAVEAADEALATAMTRLSRLRRFMNTMFLELGRAWLEAGAPGRPSTQARAELFLEEERRAYDTRFAELMATRAHLLETSAQQDERIVGERERARRAVHRFDMLLELVEAAEEVLRDEGVFRARDVLEAMPERYLTGMPAQSVPQLRDWMKKLRTRLLADQDEAELAAMRLQTREVRAMREVVQRDALVLGELKGVETAKTQNTQALEGFLRDVGKKLVPLAHTFRNGPQVADYVARAKALHDDTKARIETVESLRSRIVRSLEG